MAIVYRGTKGSRLTVAEIDGNFETLSDAVNTKVDSSDVRTLVDSAYIQARQITYNTSNFLDSNTVELVVDSAYINARVNSANSLDSSEALALIQDKLQNLNYSIIPDTDVTYDLGSSSKRFKDLYLSGTTIDLGGMKISNDGTGITIGTELIGGEVFAAGWWDTQWFKVGPKTGGPEIKVRIDDVPSDVTNQAWINFFRNIAPGDNFTIKVMQQELIVTTTVIEDHFSATQFRFYFGVNTAPAIAGNDTYVSEVSNSVYPANNLKVKYTPYTSSHWGANVPTNISSALDILASKVLDSSVAFDSNEVIQIVDSAYVRARQDYDYGSLINTPVNVSTFINDTNYLDSTTATILIDSAYVQARQTAYAGFDSDFAQKTTTDITEGNNLYYTTNRFDSDFNNKTTTDLTEGTQRYYTSARADSDARYALTGGTGVTYVPGTGTISIGQGVGTSDNVTFQTIQANNLTVSGTQTIVNTQTLNVVDPMIKMADENITDISDIGFFGQYGDGTTTRHTGLFRDASDKEYYLFSQLVDSPTSFVNRNGVDFELSTLNVGTIKASNILDSGHIEKMIQSLSTDSAAVFLLVDSAYIQARQAPVDFLNLSTNLVPSADVTYDLGTATNKWRDLYLSSSTIHLGSNTLSATDGKLKINNKVIPSADSANILVDSAVGAIIPIGQAGEQLYYSANNSRSFVKAQLVEINDKFVETAAELTEEQSDAPTLENVFNTWNRFSHSGTSQPVANNTEANAWSFDPVTNSVSIPLNTSTATGFYSNDKFADYTHTAQFTSGQSDDDIGGIVIGYVIENDQHYTLSAVRQLTGNFIQSGLTWGLVYNINQLGHTDTSRNQVLLTQRNSTAPSSAGGWSSQPNGTKIYVRKQGQYITIKTSQFNSTTIDDDTVITFDLNSDNRTKRFIGPVAYGYLAWSQGDMTFSNLEFTPDEAERLYYFQSDGSTAIYEYDAPNLQWNINTSLDLTDRSGRIFHNNKTGRTFYNDGTTTYPIGTVRQFNDVIYQLPLSSAPGVNEIGSLGLRAGMIAMADGVNWNPASKGTGRPYPVFWDGVNWLAMT